jgi:hypothetical protein
MASVMMMMAARPGFVTPLLVACSAMLAQHLAGPRVAALARAGDF